VLSSNVLHTCNPHVEQQHLEQRKQQTQVQTDVVEHVHDRAIDEGSDADQELFENMMDFAASGDQPSAGTIHFIVPCLWALPAVPLEMNEADQRMVEHFSGLPVLRRLVEDGGDVDKGEFASFSSCI